MPDTAFILLFLFLSNARFFNFLFFNIFIVWKDVSAPFPFFFQSTHPLPLLDIPPFFRKKNPPFFDNYHGKILDSMT